MATRGIATDQQSHVIDVHLLDAFAEIESLLRSCREAQRELLKLRAVSAASDVQRRGAVTKVRRIVADLRQECRALCGVIEALGPLSKALSASADGVGRRAQLPRERRAVD